MNKPTQLQSLRVRNFKAIVDSRVVKLGPLTAFIGHNGAGKSSLIEALETYQAIVRDGLDAAMQRWFGIEHARHKGQEAKERLGEPVNPIAFELALGPSPRKVSRVTLAVNNDPAANQMFIVDERITFPDKITTFEVLAPKGTAQIPAKGRSMFSAPSKDVLEIACHILDWQFLTLVPDRMGVPVPQQRTGGGVRLARDGSNIADFLLDLRRQDQNAFDGIVETMAYVLPYAKDIQPSLTSSEIERKAWLQLTEADFKVPGWMLSTGTLRLLALLALLRHPKPPPLIVVEEIENGLDPRSIHLIVEEIRNAVLDGTTQVVLTTHSPYLLDLLTLEHLVLVERDNKGHPCFLRPADNANLQRWANDFAPGKLYTMGSLGEAQQ
ncbi:AAA family ATPase [Candidatus Symbiobacter mobilis]|uniref:ATPase-like protein n=1 Tax=Candidatus Symbiobacter mobilis CR TaxID=946483 RepID=U5N5Y7_9BURK|nr:AAA family ATPase [Candidatus Symbiobacter mobilis]AGX86695.1 ATPase-like protein [Candidatus Symbiobacter mobilis CR]